MVAKQHRRGSRRQLAPTRVPTYARIAIPILLLLLVGRLLWRNPASRGSLHATGSATVGLPVAPWQRDVEDSLAESVRDADAGNITAAEVSVDRAESFITAARLQAFDAKPEFLARVNTTLDRVLEPHPQEATLFDHVTQARISLAELRSSTGTATVPGDATRRQGASNATGAAGPEPRDAAQNKSAIRIAAPRPIGANETLNPHTLGAIYIDATLMPETSEVLMPPTSRSSNHGIRVEGITIEGAAQTLDGIHWRNVTFVGTRLRYDSGDLDLEDVRFVRCRFGFLSDNRGARLASAIALGQSSITFTGPAPGPATP